MYRLEVVFSLSLRHIVWSLRSVFVETYEYPDISIGSYPYFKQRKLVVNLVMRGTNQNRLEELKEQLKATLIKIGGKILDA